ncbi:uncharacterized protein LOC122929086 [Bufo gargarizans]|uniref:uncharacterized protein LOC122929086 n=1 Tax=Bufo gargarizans TaxID=30331 RepID=UPI001CF36957|nr:uncharacterized protein LOC122929086 [Bufo gargarizans]
MTTEGDARTPVQDTGPYSKEPHLSIEETLSINKIKAFDSSVKDNVSTAFQQDGSNTMSCAHENNALKVPLSEPIFKESNLPPEGHSLNKSTTPFSETEDNVEVGYKPNDEKRAIPGASKTGQNASNFETADINNIYEDTTITGSQLQGGGDMENKSAIDLENETSTDHGRDNNDSLCSRSNIKVTDVKEEKSDGTLPMANASKGLQQDVTKDIRLDGHATMTLKFEDNTTEVLEEKMLTQEGNRSNDSTSNHFESGKNGNVGCSSSDDVLAHHEGNICSPLVGQTGRHTSSDCNQSTNILKIDVGTSTDPYDTGRKSKKRRRNKCRVDNLSKDRNPEDNISSCQERNKIGPNSQNQAPVIQKSPNALATTSNTSFQQDGNVSGITKPAHHTSLRCASDIPISSGSQIKGEGPSRACKSMSGSIFLMLFWSCVVLIMVVPMMVQAFPVQKQWQQLQFCRKDGPLNDQVLTIRNMEDRRSEDCTFIFTSVPFLKNCSESRSLFFVENTKCVDMLTEDLKTEHWRMEYNNINDEGLPAARGGRVNEKSVLEKLAKYMETVDGSAQRLSAEDNTRTDDSRRQKLWQQFWFQMNGSLIDQFVTIKDMKDRRSGGCSFTIQAVPSFHNCSQSGFFFFATNETHGEILVEDPTKEEDPEDWRLEFGHTRNGEGLSAARGEMLSEKSVLEKITEYTKPADSSAQGRSAEDIVKIMAAVGVPLLLIITLSLLYGLCQKFRSWVNEVVCRCGRRHTNNVPQTGANLESNPNNIPLLLKTSTNGTTNGGLQNGESKSETLSVGLLDRTDTTTQAEDSV